VYFTKNTFSSTNPVIADAVSSKEQDKKHRILFVVESGIIEHAPNLLSSIDSYCEAHPEQLEQSSPPVVLDGGEQLKSFHIVEELCELIDQNNLCRHSFIAIIGGGAFLDAVGFAASIVHRGIRQLRFPTTVLAQCDSGVGVKNGINMFGKKNFVGCFAPPFAVINDSNFLTTLSERDWRSGISEAIKVALIKDAYFFEWLCDNAELLAQRDIAAMEYLVERSASIHSEHITSHGDPFEFGSARPLDFGHWAAHKLEMMTANSLRHGEAVAIGIVIDSYYAMIKGMITENDFQLIENLFLCLGFNLWHDALIESENNTLSLLNGLLEFQEHLGGELHITLPDGIGAKVEANQMDLSVIKNALGYLHENYGS